MNGEWIWISQKYDYTADVYAGFKSSFSIKNNAKGEKVSLKVSCDSHFAAFVNGRLAGFSGCADYPHYKLYDEIDITDICKENNEIDFIVWYFGADSQTYIISDPGLWYEITNDGTVISASGSDTLGRLEDNYKHGHCKVITGQLGFSFAYDNTFVCDAPYLPCKRIEKMQPKRREQKNLVLTGRVEVKYLNLTDRLLVDLCREVAGYPVLDFESPCEQELIITYGEHLETGEVSRFIDGRDFSFEFKAKKGRNTWFVPLRRLAGRYMEVHFKEAVSPIYIGLEEVNYPVTKIERKFDDPLLQRIYDVSVNTLRLCMHEHYEDCPWREQALYALDSRNQILFGYSAFEETEFPRSNLALINHGLRPDGLLSICFPAGKDHPIPFFSIAYILEVSECVKFTGDRTLLEETKETIATIINTFESKIDEVGLIPSFPYPFWNFYEWSEGNAGKLSRKATDPYVKDYDLILNAFYVYVLNIYNEIAGTSYDVESVRKAIHDNLYDASKGDYKISALGELHGQLGNSLAVLAGLGDDALVEKIAECKDFTPATLSMKPFVYDALLTRGDEYKQFIIEDIKRVYKKMLDYGATSFWETELGWEDFHFAGSLCHGWSASPVHYLVALGCESNSKV